MENILSRLIRRIDNPQDYEDLLVELEPIVAVKGEPGMGKRTRGDGDNSGRRPKMESQEQGGMGDEDLMRDRQDDQEDEYDEDDDSPSITGDGGRRFSITSSAMPVNTRNLAVPSHPNLQPQLSQSSSTKPPQPLATPQSANVPLHSMYPDSSLLTHRTSTGIGDIISPTHSQRPLGRPSVSSSMSYSGNTGPFGYGMQQQPPMNQLAHAIGRVVTPSERDGFGMDQFANIAASGSGETSGLSLSALVNANNLSGIGIGIEAPSRAPSETEHAAALTLEDMALGRGQNVERAGYMRNGNIGEVSGGDREGEGSVSSKVFNMANDPAKSVLGIDMAQMKGKGPNDRTLANDHPGLNNLPSPLQAQYIINFYLHNINYLARCIHVPTFQQQCRAFWTRAPSSPYTLEEMSFVSLYTASLTVGLHLMGEVGRRDLGLTDDVAAKLTDMWWEICLVALEKADWMQVHSITSLQAVIVVGLYLPAVHRSEFHWTLCGTAIKIAYALGLSRLGPENPTANYEESRKKYGSRWAGAIDREVARRVWYSLVELDWIFSKEHNYTYTIQMESNKTAEPANINDEDLTNDKPILSQPKDVHTGMSFFLNRLQLLYPLQRLVQQVNTSGRQRYSYVTDAHAEFELAINNMSAFYRPNAEITQFANDAESMRQIVVESEVLKNAINLRLLRLHRVYFAQSFQDPKYMLSREICLNSAFSFLDAFGGPVAPSVEARYWPQTYGLFTSTVILYLYLCRVSDNQLEKAASDVQKGINALRRISGLRGLHGTADALQKLLNDECASRRTIAENRGMGKRKADDVGPDNRSSKKQLMDAPTPSATGSGTTPLINQTIDFDNNLSLFTDLPFLSDDQNIMEILNFNIPDLDYSTWGL
ncbi:hypothetical protein QFC21_007070 [Naganishia friedmannii]|uniref:Uncharacterized protein n=1 Tax=Naganishia friedmannii TaxID=89922 RepID=A0ACC2UYL3_9TREE|nr:hypothetical protein QFC21_007070 [Naganishia friedmannii]